MQVMEQSCVDIAEPLLDDDVPHLAQQHSGAVAAAVACPHTRRAALLLVALGAAVALTLLHGQGPDALPGPLAAFLGRDRSIPFCRKSTSLVVLPAPCAAANATACAAHDMLVLWSGIGKHKHIFDDAFEFDLAARRWRALRPRRGPHPVSRWKNGNALAVDGGLVVVGGDAYTPGTRCHEYKNDCWKLDYASLRWEQAQVDARQPMMEAKRGQSTMLYKGEDDLPRIVIWGGRTINKTLFNDAWELKLDWPHASWRQVSAVQPDPSKAPAPRRGHTAIYLPPAHGRNAQMLIYGGREDVLYFDDMWTLDLGTGEWSKVEVEGGAPPGRDHHVAALVDGQQMVIWGGHSGVDYFHAHPMSDLWKYDVQARRWEEVQQTGPIPLPRFEESYFQYMPKGSDEPRVVMFGGQTNDVCQLNDVWELNLKKFSWTELSPPHFCTAKCRKKYGRR